MTGFVYAIAAGDLVKIGWSAMPRLRLVKIRSDSSKPCTLLGYVAATREQETELHGLLAPWREHGEWFRREGAVEHLIDLLPPLPGMAKRRGGRPGNALREWRVAQGLSLAECAKAMETHWGSLSRIERGGRIPRPGLMARITLFTGGAVTANDFHAPISNRDVA